MDIDLFESMALAELKSLETGGRGGEERRIKESRIEKKNVFNLIETMGNVRQFMILVPKKIN